MIAPLAITIIIIIVGLIIVVVLGMRRPKVKEAIELAANAATAAGVPFLAVGILYTVLQYNLALQMASSTIDEYTAKKIDEIRNEVKKQEERLLGVSEKMEYFAEGNVFLAGGDYGGACKRFEQVLKLEPNNELALKLLGWSSTMEAVYAGFPPRADEKRKAIATTRAIEVLQKLSRIRGEGEVAFDLARAYALLGNKEACRRYLLLAEQAGTLPDRDEVLLFGMFDSVREENWYKELWSRQWEKR